jgi:hypothetical protein
VTDWQGSLNTRTAVSIQDHASKFGTWLDGAEIKDRTVTATGTSHTLKVAKMPDTLRYWFTGVFAYDSLSWQPIVFTNAGSRAAKVRQLTEKLEPFGMYPTTFVANMRNKIHQGIHESDDICHVS